MSPEKGVTNTIPRYHRLPLPRHLYQFCIKKVSGQNQSAPVAIPGHAMNEYQV